MVQFMKVQLLKDMADSTSQKTLYNKFLQQWAFRQNLYDKTFDKIVREFLEKNISVLLSCGPLS